MVVMITVGAGVACVLAGVFIIVGALAVPPPSIVGLAFFGLGALAIATSTL